MDPGASPLLTDLYQLNMIEAYLARSETKTAVFELFVQLLMSTWASKCGATKLSSPLPGTSYVVTYYRAAAFPQQLLTKSHSGREDEDAPMTQAEFHARAWKAASHKARALGWIV